MADYETFDLGTLTLQRGLTLPKAHIVYKTYGMLNPARDNFRMFDKVRCGIDYSWHERHILGQRILLDRFIFMLMPRVREFNRQRADFRLI